MARLLIGRSDSTCGKCYKSASPREKGHYTLLGYGPDNGKPGCGEDWDSVSYSYADESVEQAMLEYGPWSYESLVGLPVIGFGGNIIGQYGTRGTLFEEQ